MSYLGVQDRFQIQMRSMEEFIEKENAVRFVDAFVEQLELEKLGFEIATLKTEGRPAFNPKVFLKLYFSGYLNVWKPFEKPCLGPLKKPHWFPRIRSEGQIIPSISIEINETDATSKEIT